MFMVLSSWQRHCESSSGSFDECRTAPSGRRPKTKPDDLGCESTCAGCQSLHPPSPFIIINAKNFHGSLTTVVRAQNDTSKTASITCTIFDRTLV